jgi:hypothetical protein
MAKPIVVLFEGRSSSFDHQKVERERLYGRKVRVPLDASGQPCERAAVSDDGSLLLRSGMVAQGYFDASGDWVPFGQLVGLDASGAPLTFVPSTLGVPQLLEPVPPHVLLELDVASVHLLRPVGIDPALDRALSARTLFRFPFNYGADYHAETAILLLNDEGYFCLVGVPLLPAWSEPGHVPALEEGEGEPGPELDFEML